jgi:ribosomal protein S18 acetylase RimI-like enzyme
MSVVIAREPADSPDAAALVLELEAHLETHYPVESRRGFSVDRLVAEGVRFFVLRVDGRPAGCGGILLVEGAASGGPAYGEVKRMYVRPAYRGLGLGERILGRLGDEARAHGLSVLRLETGVHQRAAIALYERVGFRRIAPFGPYTDDPLSLCYETRLDAGSPAGEHPAGDDPSPHAAP